jgi:hypothetical protein
MMIQMRERLHIEGYKIEFDRDLTSQCYQKLCSPGPEGCGCTNCRNWIAARPDIITTKIQTFLAQFGIPPNGEIEITEWSPGQTLAHGYCGWYFIAGRILTNPNTAAFTEEFKICKFRYHFSKWMSFSVPAFDNEEVFQLNFTTEVREYSQPSHTG